MIAELVSGRAHVSELARRLGMSRPLLYMHLDKLEKAGLVTGQLELSEDGKAMKYFELAPFELRLTAATIAAALQDGHRDGRPEGTEIGADPVGDDPAGLGRPESAVGGRAYGLVTLIFQAGRLQGLLGFTGYVGDRVPGTPVHFRFPVPAEHGLPGVCPEPDPRAALPRRGHQGRRGGRHLHQCRGW